jgi:Flp pilus assembly protein TadD
LKILALAGAEAARGRPDVAIDVCRNALAADHNGDIHFELMELARDTGRHDLAIRTARDYLRNFGKDSDVLTILGHSYTALDDFRRADKAFRDAAALEPDVAEHHVNVLMVALVTENDAVFHSYFDRLAARDVNLAREVLDETKEVINELAERSVDGRG